MKANSAADDKRYSRLLELDITADDVEQAMQKAICTNKDRLECIQKQWQDQGSTNWNIDIDKLCACKYPHEAILTAVTKIS